MARVRLIHWNGPEGRERALRLSGMGHEAEFGVLDGPSGLRAVRVNPPDAFVIDLSRLPSHGREVGLALRTFKDTRHVPLVFVDGSPEKVARIRALLPDATYTTWGRLKAALPRALRRQPVAPVVPASVIASDRPLAGKLGIKSGMRVAVFGAPQGFAATLGALPKGARLTARADVSADLYVVFVRSLRELQVRLAWARDALARQTLWIAWPKKASGVKTDLTGNVIRASALAAGLVDFKVCAVDDTWSALALKVR
ncbi:MAG: hypothetical protein AB1635_13195 [Acidobacteriota bacterium]